MADSSVFKQSLKNFLSPISSLLEDPEISEIMINGPQQIFIEKNGVVIPSELTFNDEDSLQAAVRNIAQSVGRRIDQQTPRLDARLPDGSRIAAILPPCAIVGTTMTIRKFMRVNLDFKKYISIGAISPDAAQFLDICMFLGKNILISGGTGSGKTTFLELLASRIPKGQRLLIIEDAAELEINYPHLVKLESKSADAEGKGAVNIRDLLQSALRLRPDRIIVGEVRGGEALELIQAMNTGHRGCMGTIHANTPLDSLVRLEALAMSGDNTSLSRFIIQHQISSAIDIVAQVTRLASGKRCVSSIAEAIGQDDKSNYKVKELFKLNTFKTKDNKIDHKLVFCGKEPSFIEEIENNGLPFKISA